MNRVWANNRYETRPSENIAEGWFALEIFRIDTSGETLVGRLVYWDAEGQFSYEMTGEIYLSILEEAIQEAKLAIRAC